MDKRDKIFDIEYLFLALCFTLRNIQVLNFTDSTAKNDSWLVIIAGYILSLPFVLAYTALAKRFPTKNPLEIFRIVFGKVAGTIISLLYIAYFLVLLSHFLNDISEYYTEFVQTETPPILFIVVTAFAAAVALKAGIQYLVKISLFMAAVALLTISMTFTLLIGEMDFSNFLPVLRQEPKVYLQSISQFTLVPGTHLIFVFMLIPKLKSTRKLTKLTLIGFTIGILGLLIASIRNTAVLGPAASITNAASFSTVRMVNLGDIFTRGDFVVSLNVTTLSFLNICVVYYAAVQGLTQLFGLKSTKWFIIPAGVIAVVLAMTLFNSSLEHIEFAKQYNVPLYGAFHFIIPPVALLTAKLRKLKITVEDEHAGRPEDPAADSIGRRRSHVQE